MNFKNLLTFGLFALVQSQDLPSSRIIGGNEVSPPYKYPWMLSLQYLNKHRCGGMVYTNNQLITAAHCTIFEPEDWTASFHRHNLSKKGAQENGKRFKILRFETHPNYDKYKSYLNDIAIWKIDGSFGLKPKQMIKIDDGTYANSKNQLMITIGWGATQQGRKSTNILREVKVPTYDIKKCVKSYKSVKKRVNSTVMFCAGYPGGNRDTCQGDSGGPIFKVVKGKTILAGITSWGHKCGKSGFPGVYTKLYKFKSFINQKL